MAVSSLDFAAKCKEADSRYRYGKAPMTIDAERWERAREVQRKLARGSIPSTWDRPEWSPERLWRHFQHVANQARLRELAR